MSSCTEDEYSMENGSEIEYSYKTTMSPVNRLNPNDSIGVLHNIHLDSIISLLCDNYADANAIHPDTLHQFVENYFLNILKFSFTGGIIKASYRLYIFRR